MKYALFFLCIGFNLTGMTESIHIEITIEAEGTVFWLDKVNDPDAYDRLPPSKIEAFYLEARQKAKLYCRQALGSQAQTKKNKNWTNIYASTARTFAIRHYSSIQCMRELKLDSQDPTIGKYLEHADFVLNNFSDKGSLQDNHQLVENTLKILKQIKAPAVPLLWILYVKQSNSHKNPDKFIHALEDIIKSNEISTLNELLSMMFVFDSILSNNPDEYVYLAKQKANLLRVGRWHFTQFFQKTIDALDKAINNYITYDQIYGFEWTNNIGAIIAILYGLDYWINDRLNDGSINNSNDRYMRNFVYDKLINLRNRAPNINFIKEFFIVTRPFKIPLIPAIQLL